MVRQCQPTILLTRPLAQSQRFSEEIGGAIISPLMRAEFLMPELPSRNFAAVILTSETGVEAARRISAAGTSLPKRAFCVGDRTAQAAVAAGFEASSAGGDANDLLAHISQANFIGALLHFRAMHSAGDLKNRLTSAGIETVSVVAYCQQAQELSTEAVSVLRRANTIILPVFSPRSARLLAAKLQRIEPSAPIWLAALSLAVANAFTFPAERTEVAAQPNSDAMREIIARWRGVA